MGCFAHIRRKLVEVMDVAPHTPKKSHLDTAMTYAINNEKYLRYYIEDGRVEISNNSAERLYFLSSIDASNDGEAKLLGMTALGISPLYIGVVSISSSYSPL